MKSTAVLLGALAIVVASASASRAEGPIAHADAPRPATLAIRRVDAVRMGASRGPGVALAEAPRGAAGDARSASTSLPRPPTVTLAAGYRAGSLTPGAELGVSVTQDISLRSLGRERARSADAFSRAVELDTQRARLDAAARAGLAWVGALEANELVRLRRDALAQADAIAVTARARVQSGVGQPFELALAQAELGAAEAGLLDAEGLQVEAFAELRFALSLEPTFPLEVTGDLYAADERPVDEAAAIRAAETLHPALALASARAAVAEQEVRLVAATHGPTLSVGGSYVREGTGDQVVTAIVGLPIPLIDSAAYDAARQRALARVAEAQVDQVRAEIRRDLRLALHDREHWREVRDSLASKAVAPSQEALRIARVQYEVGTSDISAVLLARQRLLGTEELLTRAAAGVQRADLGVDRAAGTLLRGGT